MLHLSILRFDQWMPRDSTKYHDVMSGHHFKYSHENDSNNYGESFNSTCSKIKYLIAQNNIPGEATEMSKNFERYCKSKLGPK